MVDSTGLPLVAAALLLLMQCGFALLVSGFARARSVVHAAVGVIVVYNVALLGAWIAGAVIEGQGSPGQLLVLACIGTIASVIPTGALVQRWRFPSMVIVTIAISAAIYPMAAHWIWGGGWLSQLGRMAGLGHGVIDVGGSGVVHVVGGMAALAGSRVVGPRRHKFGRDGQPQAMPGHHVPMFLAGTLFIAAGWFGFLLGRALPPGTNALAHAAANLVLASAASTLAASSYMYWRFGTPDPSLVSNALVAGLVSMSAGCAFVSSGAAIVIGAIAGPLVVQSVLLVERTLRVDDPVGAVSTHGICGIWGLLAVGLFANGTAGDGWNGVGGAVKGLFYGDGSQLAAQAAGAAIVAGVALAAALLVFLVLDRTLGNRVTADAEMDGLDVAELGSTAYPDFGVTESGYDSHP